MKSKQTKLSVKIVNNPNSKNTCCLVHLVISVWPVQCASPLPDLSRKFCQFFLPYLMIFPTFLWILEHFLFDKAALLPHSTTFKLDRETLCMYTGRVRMWSTRAMTSIFWDRGRGDARVKLRSPNGPINKCFCGSVCLLFLLRALFVYFSFDRCQKYVLQTTNQ